MFAADSDLQIRARLAAFLHGNLHQLAHALLIDGGKRIALQNPSLDVSRQEFADVIAREAVRSLRKIVCAEAEELRIGSNLIGNRASARQLNHRPDQILNSSSLFFKDLLSHLTNNGPLIFHLLHHPHKWDHDFREDLYALL